MQRPNIWAFFYYKLYNSPQILIILPVIMKANEILKVTTINELKTYGSYFEIKHFFEKKIDNKLGVSGWESLFSKIQSLKTIVPSNKEALESACKRKNFKESKKEISEILKTRVKAKDCDDLKKKVDLLVTVFCSSVFDPYRHYERTKLKKFKDSSKLEGIDIEISDENASLESVLAKYRR